MRFFVVALAVGLCLAAHGASGIKVVKKHHHRTHRATANNTLQLGSEVETRAVGEPIGCMSAGTIFHGVDADKGPISGSGAWKSRHIRLLCGLDSENKLVLQMDWGTSEANAGDKGSGLLRTMPTGSQVAANTCPTVRGRSTAYTAFPSRYNANNLMCIALTSDKNLRINMPCQEDRDQFRDMINAHVTRLGALNTGDSLARIAFEVEYKNTKTAIITHGGFYDVECGMHMWTGDDSLWEITVDNAGNTPFAVPDAWPQCKAKLTALLDDPADVPADTKVPEYKFKRGEKEITKPAHDRSGILEIRTNGVLRLDTTVVGMARDALKSFADTVQQGCNDKTDEGKFGPFRGMIAKPYMNYARSFALFAPACDNPVAMVPSETQVTLDVRLASLVASRSPIIEESVVQAINGRDDTGTLYAAVIACPKVSRVLDTLDTDKADELKGFIKLSVYFANRGLGLKMGINPMPKVDMCQLGPNVKVHLGLDDTVFAELGRDIIDFIIDYKKTSKQSKKSVTQVQGVEEVHPSMMIANFFKNSGEGYGDEKAYCVGRFFGYAHPDAFGRCETECSCIHMRDRSEVSEGGKEHVRKGCPFNGHAGAFSTKIRGKFLEIAMELRQDTTINPYLHDTGSNLDTLINDLKQDYQEV